MPSQYVVKRNATGGYDLWMRDLITHEEYRARYSHMVRECGFSEDEAAHELFLMVGQFIKKTISKTATLDMCQKYIFDTIDPGDIIFIEGLPMVVQKPVTV